VVDPTGRLLAFHANNRSPDRESVRYSIKQELRLWTIDVVISAASADDGTGPDGVAALLAGRKQIACP